MLKMIVDHETPEINPMAMMTGGQPQNLDGLISYHSCLNWDIPVDVFRIEDLSGTRSVVDGEDWSGSKVRGHGEVRNGANKERDGEEIMEDLLSLGSEECKANDDEEGETVDCCHCPEPIRPRSGEVVDITSGWVDLEGIVGTLEETHFDF
jgi:hypothetical protein